MQDIRVSLEQLTNSNLNLQLEINNLKLELVRLLAESKVERSDKLLTAGEAKEKLGISNDTLWAKVKYDPTFPKLRLTDGGNLKYSDKAIDLWIINKIK